MTGWGELSAAKGGTELLLETINSVSLSVFSINDQFDGLLHFKDILSNLVWVVNWDQ